MMPARDLIETLKLKSHPEGGYFSEIHRSAQVVSLQSHHYDGEKRQAGTVIYYLLQETNYSAWHRLRSDESWHFHKGSPLRLYIIDQDYNFNTVILGDPAETKGAMFCTVAKANVWFAAELMDKSSYSLVSCVVYPGFEYQDFELADKSIIEILVEHCPKYESTIRLLASSI